ncbi:MAG: DUF6503 family protein [Bacteroidota bacterium]
MKNILPFLTLSIFLSCSNTPSSQQVVDAAIKASGSEKLLSSEVSFTFRGVTYTYTRSEGNYTFSRVRKDTFNNEMKDILTNNGLVRYVNQVETDITSEKRDAYAASVNSVIYFAFLPLGLNDNAVNKSYISKVNIKGKQYHKIKVTFNQEGGGEDYEDVFYYWFDTEDFSMDYLAYSYNEEDGKGMRFREAFNSRLINGVVIQDYKNLKPKVKGSVSLEQIDQAYINEGLEELSLIELKDIRIMLN